MRLSFSSQSQPLTPSGDVDPDLYLCRYPSRRCLAYQATKRNGELHRFCEKHRDRANISQRKLDRKRRSTSMSSSALPKYKRSNSEPIIIHVQPLPTSFTQPPSSPIFSNQREMDFFLECLDLR